MLGFHDVDTARKRKRAPSEKKKKMSDRRKRKRRDSSTDRRKRSVSLSIKEADTYMYEGINEVFVISLSDMKDVRRVICKQVTPTCKKLKEWGKCKVSFYRKLCTFIGVDHQHLEDQSPQPSSSECPPPVRTTGWNVPIRKLVSDPEMYKRLNDLYKELEKAGYSCSPALDDDGFPYHLYPHVGLKLPAHVEFGAVKFQQVPTDLDYDPVKHQMLREMCEKVENVPIRKLVSDPEMYKRLNDLYKELEKPDSYCSPPLDPEGFPYHLYHHVGLKLPAHVEFGAVKFQVPTDMEYDPVKHRMLREMCEKDVIDGQMPLRIFRRGPFKSGSYAPGTEPECIPSHLYLLVKKAADSNTTPKDLEIVEKKISFFSKYFHSHLPTNWVYERDNASSLIADYDTILAKSGPKDLMAGYTPTKDLDDVAFDEEVNLTEYDIAGIMGIIYSRKTPAFKYCSMLVMSFYLKLCSCFGIDYSRLEDASEDDVRLMNTGIQLLAWR